MFSLPRIVLLFAGLAACPIADDVLWVTDVDADARLVGHEVTVEGAFQQRVGANRDQIVLKSCKVPFQIPPDSLIAIPSSLSGGLRITGKLIKQNDKLVVQIKSLEKTARSDVDRFQTASAALSAVDAPGWNALADRTQRLADALPSAELNQLARDTRAKGFRAEELSLRPNQPDELMRLATRAKDLGFRAEETRRITHKSLRWRFDLLISANASSDDWMKLESLIAQSLPESQKIATANIDAHVRRYRTNPIEVYETDHESRTVFDRTLYGDVAARSLLQRSNLADTDLLRLAEEAKRRLPDRPDISIQLLTRWADSEIDTVASIPPSSRVRKLVDVIRNDLNDPDKARAVLRHWFEARRGKLARSADGRVQLAREYRSELNDVETAVKLLLEAIEIEPDLPDAAAELKALGYVKGVRGWVPANDPSVAQNDMTGKATRIRLPEVGMSPDQVVAILGQPKPQEIVRLATGGRVLEQWSYRGPPDIHVQFLLSASGPKVHIIKTHSRR